FATKAWQIPEAAERAKPLIGKDTIAVPLENGMEAPEQLAHAFGREHVLGGLCGIVAYIVAPGHIRHAAIDPFVMFGELDNSRSERAEKLRAAFERAGIKADIPADIHRAMWSKFLFIAPMSAIGALTRVPVGVWREVPETREIAVRALGEIVAVAAARGIDLGVDAVQRTLERYDAMAPDSTSSLQRDIMEGKPSELEAQAAAIVRLIDHLDQTFVDVVELINGSNGRVITMGLGKSGIICKKISGTLASTGTPSFFLHPAEAIHGDLGMIVSGDVVLCVSNS